MSVKIGFVILSHGEPGQVLRLASTLTKMFGDVPIVCHHDFSKCALNRCLFPKNVRFVQPHVVTGWGDVSVISASLKAFNLLREHKPDWFVLLSGSDYPVRHASEILTERSASGLDAFLDAREIPYG